VLPSLAHRTYLASLLLAPFTTGASAQAVRLAPGIEQLAERELLAESATGGVVALITGNSPVTLAAVGHQDAQRNVPMEADLLFGTGGFDDVLTALATVLLARDGTVALHAPIRTYAPDLPPRIGSVTLVQLLSHTAGLDDAEDDPAPRPRPGSRIWPGATDRALFTEPGRIYSHSRYSYFLARAILSEVTGRPFSDLIHERILVPAGMERSTLDGTAAEAMGAAPGYLITSDAEGPVRPLRPSESPLRQLYATAGDIARLLQLGMGESDGVSPVAAFDTLIAARAALPVIPGDSVAFGLRVRRFRGARQLSYESTIAGYGTLVRFIPDARVGVVMFGNATGAVLRTTADTLLSALLRNAGYAMGDDSAILAEPDMPDDPAVYAGTYANGDRIVVLEVHQGELHWRDGDILLRVRREGTRLDVLVPDGRIAQVLHFARDAEGTSYLFVGNRAYRRE